MRRFIASLDIGSSLLKLVVAEIVKDKVNILACVETPARGIKKGYVINGESATESLKEIFTKAENVVGLPIKKVLVSVPSKYAECFLSSSIISTINEDRVIRTEDIIKAMQKCVYNKVDESKELVTVLPTGFKVNDEIVTNPLNMISEGLAMKGVVVTVPKKTFKELEYV